MAKHVLISNDSIQSTSTKSSGRILVQEASGQLHVVWVALGVAAEEIRYATSTDEGATWTDGAGGGSGTFFLVSSGLVGEDGENPTIAIDSVGTLHVVWEEISNDILVYRNRTTIGTWGAVDNTSLVVVSVMAQPAIVVASDDSIHIVAANVSTNSVYWAFSIDGGTTWTLSENQIASAASTFPRMGFDADSSFNLHLVFIRSTNKAGYAKATFISPGVWTWGAVDTTSLNDATVSSQGDCDLLVADATGDIFASWEAIFSGVTGIRIRGAKSTDGGSTWSAHSNEAYVATTTTAFRTPVHGSNASGNTFGVHRQYYNSGGTKISAFISIDQQPGKGKAFNPSYFASSFGGVHDIFMEEDASSALLTDYPSTPRRVLSGATVIPTVFTDQRAIKTVRFTTFDNRFSAVHIESAANNLLIPDRQSIIRTSPTEFHVVFQQPIGFGVNDDTTLYYKKSTDGGITWTDGEGGAPNSSFLIEFSTTLRQGPSMAIDSLGNIFLAWSSVTPSPVQVFFKRRVGGIWQATDSATFTDASQVRNPIMLVDKFDNVHILARRMTSPAGTLYHAVSTNQGASWTITPAAAALTTTTTFGVSWASAEYDASNNLHLITKDVSPVNSGKGLLAYLSAAFTSPSTWTWGTIDRTSFEHPDDLEDVFTLFDISADRNATDDRVDIVWTAQGGGTASTRTVLHGTIINGTPSFSVIQTFNNTNPGNIRRPNTGNLARDASGHLYCSIAYVTAFLGGGLYGDAILLAKGAPTWVGFSTPHRRLNSMSSATIERRPQLSVGDVYGFMSPTLTTGDDHNVLLLEPMIEGLPPLTVTTQTINSNTEVVPLPSKDFFASA